MAVAGGGPGHQDWWAQLQQTNPGIIAQYPGLARWPEYYKQMWAYYVMQDNYDAARQIVAAAQSSAWQYNSAGLLYPNQPWFLRLDKAMQDMIVRYLNDAGALQADITAAMNAGDTAKAQQLQAYAADIQQLRAQAEQYMNSGADPAATMPNLYVPTSFGANGAGDVVPPTESQNPGQSPPGQAPQNPANPAPPSDPNAGPGMTTPGGAADQGMYGQDVDEAARSDPRSFVGYVLGQMGYDPYGLNPLSASALRKATLTPYMRELMAGGYKNAPLYTYADFLDNWTRNNSAPGAAGGGNGTAFSFGQGKQAIGDLLGRATNPDNFEYDALNGSGVDDAANNLKTYFAAGFSDSLDPTYQRAAQAYIDRKKQDYYSGLYGGTGQADQTFIDWFRQNGMNF